MQIGWQLIDERVRKRKSKRERKRQRERKRKSAPLRPGLRGQSVDIPQLSAMLEIGLNYKELPYARSHSILGSPHSNNTITGRAWRPAHFSTTSDIPEDPCGFSIFEFESKLTFWLSPFLLCLPPFHWLNQRKILQPQLESASCTCIHTYIHTYKCVYTYTFLNPYQG